MAIKAMCVCLLAMFLLQAPSSEAGQVPGLRGQTTPPPINTTDVEKVLLAEMSGVFSGGSPNAHISRLEAALEPMFTAVPKEEDGTLSHAVVRYVLHRYFESQHGWFIRGLEPGNATTIQTDRKTGAQTLQTLSEWVPNFLQKFLEELHGGRGISLRELAVLAATFEDLIHKEAIQRLEMTFTALQLPFNTSLDHEQLHQALEVYMMIYMLGGNFTITGQQGILRAHRIFAKKVKDWSQVQEWMRGIQLEVAPASEYGSLNFTAASRVVEEIGRRYAAYNDAACTRLKDEVLKIESTKAGRVRLAEFYKKGLSTMFEFNEKVEYLRILGTIDDSDPKDPHLIVPNYVASRPNCLRASTFYVVCCRNDCEELQGSIEKKFEKPSVDPEQILELVATMSTKTIEAPRKLPDSLVRRLKSIADANDGVVPLHGRLFAQWMHHAFPRECPYPHKAGKAAPMTADEWMTATGHDTAKKTDEEMQVIVASDSCTLPVGQKAREHHNLPENELQWDDEEELLRPQRSTAQQDVVTETEAPQAPKRSMFGTAAPCAMFAFIFLSIGANVWKLLPKSKDAALREVMV